MIDKKPLGGPPRRSKDGTRKRAAKPKVRTGCITCKVRRVKCDEMRPECLRCVKFGEYLFATRRGELVADVRGRRQMRWLPRAASTAGLRPGALRLEQTPRAVLVEEHFRCLGGAEYGSFPIPGRISLLPALRYENRESSQRFLRPYSVEPNRSPGFRSRRVNPPCRDLHRGS